MQSPCCYRHLHQHCQINRSQAPSPRQLGTVRHQPDHPCSSPFSPTCPPHPHHVGQPFRACYALPEEATYPMWGPACWCRCLCRMWYTLHGLAHLWCTLSAFKLCSIWLKPDCIDLGPDNVWQYLHLFSHHCLPLQVHSTFYLICVCSHTIAYCSRCVVVFIKSVHVLTPSSAAPDPAHATRIIGYEPQRSGVLEDKQHMRFTIEEVLRIPSCSYYSSEPGKLAKQFACHHPCPLRTLLPNRSAHAQTLFDCAISFGH
jgi:hypothetical protein